MWCIVYKTNINCYVQIYKFYWFHEYTSLKSDRVNLFLNIVASFVKASVDAVACVLVK